MGMSASQARLLSITSRLTNNEFRSQVITNSKLRLADKSSEASAEYMNALNSKQLMYMYYNDKGESCKENLTPAIIYEYASNKNQYALVNSAGKILVSDKDAKNYENTNSLSEFLAAYKLVDLVIETEEQTVVNPAYAVEMEKYNKEHQEWEVSKPQEIDFNKFDVDNRLYSDYMDMIQGSSCYDHTKKHDKRCYMHLLNDLIGLGSHTTSTGEQFEVDTFHNMGGWQWNTTEFPDPSETSLSINERVRERMCKEDGRFAGKTVYQAIVDFVYGSKDLYEKGNSTGGVATDEELETFWYIIEEELKSALFDFDEERYNKAVQEWQDSEPQKPDLPETITETKVISEDIVIKDKNKSQWYTNLWYMMNGSVSSNIINEKEYTDINNNSSVISNIAGVMKSPTGGNFEIFEDNLYTNSEWLQFALEHGVLTISHAEFDNPAVDSGKKSEITSQGISWTSIPYTNATDIISTDNETAIAIAEVKYKRALTEIENKDKKFDQDLKKLDSEHSALQTEYDSIKEVISKNVDRSFKAFS